MFRTGDTSTPLRRNPGIDALRTLAILGMMAAHTSRLIAYQIRPEWSRWVLQLEPLIPSLFLFLVGVSLTYSISKSADKKTWFQKQTRRALALWLISALFFGLEEGIRLPDIFMASGILCTIAYAIVSIGSLLLLRPTVWGLGFAFVAGSVLFFVLDHRGARTFYLISGNSPFFPLWLFAVAGALWGAARQKFPRAILWAGVPTLFAAFWLLRRYGLEPLFTYPLGRSDATRLLAAPLNGGIPNSVAYYNLTPLLSIFCLCIHIGLAGFMTGALFKLKEIWATRLFSLGRCALEVYILHLSLLAILVVAWGLHPLKTPAQVAWSLAIVAGICLIWSYFRKKSLF